MAAKPLAELAERWEQEAETLARYRDERGAHLCRMHAAELREAVAERGRQTLTLNEAAGESGYTEDHLRHLVADGTIPNAGRKGAPRIQRRDLPMKPGHDPNVLEAQAAQIAEEIGRRSGR